MRTTLLENSSGDALIVLNAQDLADINLNPTQVTLDENKGHVAIERIS